MFNSRIDLFNSQISKSLYYAIKYIARTSSVALLIMLLFIVGCSTTNETQKTFIPVSYIQNPDTFIIGQSRDYTRVYFYGIDENGDKVLIKSASYELNITIDYNSINPYFMPTTRHICNYRGGILVINKPVKFMTIDESQVNVHSYKIKQ